MPKKLKDKDGTERVVFDPTDPKDMEIAHTIAKAQLAEMNGKSQTEEGVDYKEKYEEVKDKLDLVIEAQIEKKMNELGINDPEQREEFLQNPDLLMGYEKGVKEAQKTEKGGGRGVLTPEQLAGTGGSSLSPEQLAGSTATRGQEFGSVEDMVDTLRDRASNGDKMAEAQLEEMLRKWARGMKEQPHQSTYEDKEFRTLENLRTQKRRRRLQSGNYREER